MQFRLSYFLFFIFYMFTCFVAIWFWVGAHAGRGASAGQSTDLLFILYIVSVFIGLIYSGLNIKNPDERGYLFGLALPVFAAMVCFIVIIFGNSRSNKPKMMIGEPEVQMMIKPIKENRLKDHTTGVLIDRESRFIETVLHTFA